MTHPSRNSRRSFIKTLGAAAVAAPFITRGLMAAPPSGALRHACFGAMGMGKTDLTQISSCDNVEITAICDVDLARMAWARKEFPRARFYQDWRELLDKEQDNIDSVSVSVPDHMHAAIGLAAMRLGKHLYGQKPLAHGLLETRCMTETARDKKVVTQMGIQFHSTAHYRMAVGIIQSGAIGKIKEVHSWCHKTWGDPRKKPDRDDPVPVGLDWDLWLGVCAARPYIGDKYYHPGNWRKRLDFGVGTLGDMACHIFDPVFESIGLAAPVSVRSEGPVPNRDNWAIDAKVSYTFAGTSHTAGKTMRLDWYDGKQRPPGAVVALIEDAPLPNSGSIFIGTEGVMLLPHGGGGAPVLYPRAQFTGYRPPRVLGANHWKQFVEACRGNGKTTADFDYAGPLTEAVLLGGVAARFQHVTLGWDSRAMKFDHAGAGQYVSRNYRKGWEVAGL